MKASIQKTTVTSQHIEVIISDTPESEAATLWIQVAVSLPTDRDWPLAGLQAVALRDARNELTEQIQAIEQIHGRAP
jgi:hypothetical protein